MNLNTTIQRKPDDKYAIGDLWPGIKKYFKKTLLKDLIEEIDKLLLIRNLLGAHYNEWAISFSNHELRHFGNSVQQFYKYVFCIDCQSWLRNNGECKCGKIKIE